MKEASCAMPFRNEKGITLVEALAATVILSLVVLTFVTLSSTVSRADDRTDHSTEALRIAELNLNYARDFYIRNNTIPADEFPDSAEGGYEVEIQQTDLIGNPAAYNTTSFGERHVSLQTIVFGGTPPIPRLITVTVSWEEIE
jgi:type II secretory pathway pseudopilin PulG